MTIGKRIKRLRRELDLTQSEFAARIGSVQNTITGYENDRRNPSLPVISLICHEFNVSETWLRTGEGEMFEDINISPAFSFATEVNCNNLELHFLESYFNLSDRERKAFCEILLKMFPNAFTDVPNPLEKVWQEAPPLSETTQPAARTPTGQDDIEALAQRAAEITREQAISEEKPDAPASSANGSAVG